MSKSYRLACNMLLSKLSVVIVVAPPSTPQRALRSQRAVLVCPNTDVRRGFEPLLIPEHDASRALATRSSKARARHDPQDSGLPAGARRHRGFARFHRRGHR